MLFVVSAPLDELPPPCCRVDGLAAFDLTLGRRSESTGPDADGGFLGVPDDLGAGDCVRDDAADDSSEDKALCRCGTCSEEAEPFDRKAAVSCLTCRAVPADIYSSS